MINKQPAFSAKNFYKNSANCQIKNSYLENLKIQIAKIDRRVSRQFMPLAIDSLDSALSGGLALGRVHGHQLRGQHDYPWRQHLALGAFPGLGGLLDRSQLVEQPVVATFVVVDGHVLLLVR